MERAFGEDVYSTTEPGVHQLETSKPSKLEYLLKSLRQIGNGVILATMNFRSPKSCTFKLQFFQCFENTVFGVESNGGVGKIEK